MERGEKKAMATASKNKCVLADKRRVNDKYIVVFPSDAKTCFFRNDLECRAMKESAMVDCPLGFKHPWDRK